MTSFTRSSPDRATARSRESSGRTTGERTRGSPSRQHRPDIARHRTAQIVAFTKPGNVEVATVAFAWQQHRARRGAGYCIGRSGSRGKTADADPLQESRRSRRKTPTGSACPSGRRSGDATSQNGQIQRRGPKERASRRSSSAQASRRNGTRTEPRAPTDGPLARSGSGVRSMGAAGSGSLRKRD